MKCKTLNLIILMLVFVSCENKPLDILGTFPQINEIKMEETPLVCDKIGTPVDMMNIDSLLIVMDYYYKHNFSIINLKNFQHHMYFGSKGRGPGELNHASNFNITKRNEEIVVFDDMPKTFFKYPINKILSEELSGVEFQKQKTNYPAYGGAYINDSLKILMIGSFENRYGIFNKDGEMINSFGAYPKSEDIEFPKEANPLTFQSTIDVKPDKSRFVTACYKTPIFEIYDITDNNVKNVVKLHYGFPKVLPEITKSSRSVTTLADNKYGFIDITVDDHHIYALYSGRTINEFGSNASYGNHILVYDWEGNPIKILKFGVDLTSIAIDEKGNGIYGFSETPEIKLHYASLSGN